MAKSVGIASVLVGLMALAMCQKAPDGPAATAITAAADLPARGAGLPTDTDDRATVGAAHADCRARPIRSAKRVARLARGDDVTVLERRTGWARVASLGGDCWLMLATLRPPIDATPPPVSAPSIDTPSRSVSTPRFVARRTSRRQRFYDTGGACPCGSGRVCVGPRGGRYCITSGGNKEYGQ